MVKYEQSEVINHQQNKLKLISKRLNVELRRVKLFKRENDNLHSKIILLELMLCHGDYCTSSTKVLRVLNTMAIKIEAKYIIAALQAKLQKTQEKLQAVEELKGQIAFFSYTCKRKSIGKEGLYYLQ